MIKVIHNAETNERIEIELTPEELEDFKERDDDNWMKHTLAWQDGEKVKIDYRNVHNFTLSNEVQYFPPKARVY